MQRRTTLGTRRAISWAIGLALALCFTATARADYEWQTYATPITSAEPGLAVHAGQLYAYGGSSSNNGSNSTCSDKLWSMNLANNQWQTMQGTLPYGMLANYCVPPVVVGDRIILSPSLGPNVSGGWGSHDRVIEYSFAADQFSQTAQYPNAAIWDLYLVNVGTASSPNVYSFGGWTGGGLSDIYHYDTVTQSLTKVTTASLSLGRVLSSAWAAPNGKVYLFGGNYPAAARRVEVFDPATGTLSSLGDILPADMIVGSTAPSELAWTDNSGKAVVACLGSGFQKVYEFDPATNIFTPSSMTLPTYTSGHLSSGLGYYDSTTGDIYLTEYLWTGSSYETNLIVGTPVPEPATLSLLALGGLAMLRRARRR